MNNEIDYKELYEAKCEEIHQLEMCNRELYKELKETENDLKSEAYFNEMKLAICLFIGGIIMYLMFNCFNNFDDWAFGLPLWKIFGTILGKILIGAAYSFSYLAIGNILNIFVKDAPNGKSVTIRLVLTILFFVIVPISLNILF